MLSRSSGSDIRPLGLPPHFRGRTIPDLSLVAPRTDHAMSRVISSLGTILTLLAVLVLPSALAAQITPQKAADALRLREVGPAVAGGRIADVEVHPNDHSTWYVGVGSGGVWKTTNAGTTFTPIFDDQPTYSIGEIALAPSNPEIVWVGTGENVSGRHVAWGTGVYRSLNGGTSWENMGLGESEHIGKILIHPENSDIVLVASEGPLWSAGGERGVYMSDDGGETAGRQRTRS